MRVMALSSTSFFAKYLHVVEDGPGRGQLCHTDTFLVLFCIAGMPSLILSENNKETHPQGF